MEVVEFGAVQWHVTPAGELLRETAYNIDRKWGKIFDILLMAGSKSDKLEEWVKNLVLGGVAYAGPASGGNTFFGLWGAAASIGDASHGGTAGEITGGAYNRVTVVNNTTNFASVTTAAKVNSTAIIFPQASADWNAAANINQVGCLDGNLKTSADLLLLWGDLTVPKPVLNQDTAQFAASAFSWTED